MTLRALYLALGGDPDPLLAAAQTEASDTVINELIEKDKMRRAEEKLHADIMKQMGLR